MRRRYANGLSHYNPPPLFPALCACLFVPPAIPALPTLDQLADGTAVEADDDDLWTSAPVSAAYVTTETYQPAVLTPAFFDPDTADPEDDDPSVRDDHPWWLRKLETIAPRPRPLDISPEADPTHPARRYAWWSPFVHLTAGAAAGLASRTITAPLSVTRIHLQLTNEPVKSHWPSHFPGVASSLRSIYQVGRTCGAGVPVEP